MHQRLARLTWKLDARLRKPDRHADEALLCLLFFVCCSVVSHVSLVLLVSFVCWYVGSLVLWFVGFLGIWVVGWVVGWVVACWLGCWLSWGGGCGCGCCCMLVSLVWFGLVCFVVGGGWCGGCRCGCCCRYCGRCCGRCFGRRLTRSKVFGHTTTRSNWHPSPKTPLRAGTRRSNGCSPKNTAICGKNPFRPAAIPPEELVEIFKMSKCGQREDLNLRILAHRHEENAFYKKNMGMRDQVSRHVQER